MGVRVLLDSALCNPLFPSLTLISSFQTQPVGALSAPLLSPGGVSSCPLYWLDSANRLFLINAPVQCILELILFYQVGVFMVCLWWGGVGDL